MRFRIKSLLSDSCSGKFFNTSNDSIPTTHNELVGGNRQERSKEFQNKRFFNKNKKSLLLEGKAMGELRNVNINLLDVEKSNFNPYILNPDDYETQEDLFNAIENWWIIRRRGNQSTIKKRIAIAKRLNNHEIYPIDWRNLTAQQVLLYLEYREYNEDAGIHAIRNEWDTITTVCIAYGINYEKWNYKPPSRPPAKKKIIPLPPETHNIIHHKYSKNPYENALFQYILNIGFTLGLRPSEIVILKKLDIYFDERYIIITEPKKHNQERQIFLENDILNSPKRKSLKNWVEHWMLDSDEGYLFLQPNGRPYTVAYLRKVLTPLVKEVYPHFSLYTMRHWCAIARLIRSYIENGSWDKTDVQDWLGHEKVTTTDGYTKYAKKYYQIAKYDWIKAILKSPNIWREDNSLNSKKPQKTCVSNGNNRSEKERTWRRLNLFSPVKKINKNLKIGGFDFSTSLIKPFFLSFSVFSFTRPNTLIDILRSSPDGEDQRHQGFQYSPKGWGIGGLL